MKRHIYILFFILSLLYSQDYCAGDQISDAHQNRTFNVCYGDCDCEAWSLSDYAGDIIFLDLSAAWCVPCFSSIDAIDDLEEYWSDTNPNVKFVTALSDIGQPYGCEEWGNEGILGSPLIVADDGQLHDWFIGSGEYPGYVLIDHTMTVRSKPSNIFSNNNDGVCDSDNLEGECLNELITNLLDECGDGCSSGAGCNDEDACNNGDSADCIYPQNNYDCCGECAVGVDCLGVCGGVANEDECSNNTGECPTCIIVPSDNYPTIQSGIDAAVDGDTVLVEQGIYVENLILQKTITLTSRAIFDNLSGWVGYEDEFVVLNDNITGTIIDGSGDTNGEGFESTIMIASPGSACDGGTPCELNGDCVTAGDGIVCTVTEECIEPLIFGFTITGGSGTVLDVEVEGGGGQRERVRRRIGGGFLALQALPTVQLNAIINNIADEGEDQELFSAGGGAVDNGGQFPSVELPPNFIFNPTRLECNEDVDFSSNLWKGNDADYGNTLSATDFAGNIDMTSSIFDVYNCPEDEVTPVWVYVGEEVDVNFDNGVGNLCSIAEDVWVSPNGDDDNLGTSEAEAFLTIQRALEMIAPQDDDPIIVNVAEGTFAPSTSDEIFPVVMISNTTLRGQGVELTILDAEQTGKVILMDNLKNSFIEQLTLTGGVSAFSTPNHGAGIYIANSTGIGFDYLTVRDNAALGTNSYNSDSYVNGMGMYVVNSDFTLSNAKIHNNYELDPGHYERHGGGMAIVNSTFTMKNILVRDNIVHKAGGLLISSSDGTIKNAVVYGNKASRGAGFFIDGGSDITMDRVTIKNNGQASEGGIGSAGDYANGGSGILLRDDSTNLIVKNSQLAENYAYSSAAILVMEGTLLLQNSLVNNNFNYSGDTYHKAAISISEKGNVDGDAGWGAGEASALFVNCTFVNNSTIREIAIGDGGQLKFINSILGGGGNGNDDILLTGCGTDDRLEIYNSNIGGEPNGYGGGGVNHCGNYIDYENPLNEEVITQNQDVLFTVPCLMPDCGLEEVSTPWYAADYYLYGNPDYSLQSGSVSTNSGTANISQYSYEGMVVEDILNYSGSAPEMGYLERCEVGELDLCGVCEGDNSSCADCHGVVGGDAYIDDCATCDSNPDNDCMLDECGVLGGNGGPCLGDINNDSVINIMDLIIIIELILCGGLDDYSDGEWDAGLDHCNEYFLTQATFLDADYDNNNNVNVGDIVAIIEYEIYNTLGRSIVSVDEINIYKSDEGLYIESIGFVALDITISHGETFNYSITRDAFINRDITSEDITRMIIVDPGSNLLFTTENLFEVENIMAVTAGGKSVKVNMVDSMGIPEEYSLSNAYPNPFNPSTTIEYYLSNNTKISIAIYDLQGREIASLVNDVVSAGNHSILWNANNYSSGIYFLKMVAGNFTETQKLVMVK